MAVSVHPLATAGPLWIDHVVLAVDDVTAAAAQFTADHGLASYPTPTATGLAGRIVPCGAGYLCLVAIVDASDASTSLLGGAVLAARRDHRLLLSWAVATDEIGPFVRRTGRDPTDDEVSASDGSPLRRRSLGADIALCSTLPAIVCWDGPAGRHPERQPVDHRIDPVGITCIELGVDETQLRSWLGPGVHDLPLKLTGGTLRLHEVTVATAAGDVVISDRRAGDYVARGARTGDD